MRCREPVEVDGASGKDEERGFVIVGVALEESLSEEEPPPKKPPKAMVEEDDCVAGELRC